MEESAMNPKITEQLIREHFELPDEIPEVIEVKYKDLVEYTNKITEIIYMAALRAVHKQNEDNLHKINMN